MNAHTYSAYSEAAPEHADARRRQVLVELADFLNTVAVTRDLDGMEARLRELLGGEAYNALWAHPAWYHIGPDAPPFQRRTSMAAIALNSIKALRSGPDAGSLTHTMTGSGKLMAHAYEPYTWGQLKSQFDAALQQKIQWERTLAQVQAATAMSHDQLEALARSVRATSAATGGNALEHLDMVASLLQQPSTDIGGAVGRAIIAQAQLADAQLRAERMIANGGGVGGAMSGDVDPTHLKARTQGARRARALARSQHWKRPGSARHTRERG